MVAYDPHRPPDSPSLPAETVARLRDALREALARRSPTQHATAAAAAGADPDPDVALCDALGDASRQARAIMVRPETLVVLLKQLEEELIELEPALRRVTPDERRRLREWVVTTCVRAYFDR